MHEIKCPHCGKEFTIDEASYADIQNQVRTKEFNDDIREKLEQLRVQQATELALLEEKAKNKFEAELAQREKDILALNSKLQSYDQEKQLAVKSVESVMQNRLSEQEKKIVELSTKAQNLVYENDKVMMNKEKELNEVINRLKLELQHINSEKKSEIAQVVSDKEKEAIEIKAKLVIQEKEKELEIASINDKYRNELKHKG